MVGNPLRFAAGIKSVLAIDTWLNVKSDPVTFKLPAIVCTVASSL